MACYGLWPARGASCCKRCQWAARRRWGQLGGGAFAWGSGLGFESRCAFAWGVMGAQTRYTNKPFYPNGLVVGILTEGG
ncbi:unnamed protein product [Closterium sp. NIES-54]